MSNSRALANHERQVQMQRFNRAGYRMLILAATVLSFMTVSLLAIDQLYRPQAFAIDQLKIQGKFKYLDVRDVENAVLDQPIGNFFAVDLERIKQRVESLPWVQYADLRREWPNTLRIYIAEHRPVMRWHDTQWVNALGQVINVPVGAVTIQRAIKLAGNADDAQFILHHAFEWSKQLAKDGLELIEVSLSDSHAWTLTVYHGLSDSRFDLLLGRVNANRRLERFRALFDQRFSNVKQRLERVDARYPDGLAIKSTPLENDSNDSAVSEELAVNQ